MKISKIFAGMSALALATTAVIPAFAEKEILDSTGLDYVEVKQDSGVYQYYIDLAASPYDPATVSSIKYTFTIDDSESGFGGGLMLNSKKSGWDQDGTTPGDWGSEGSEKTLTPEGSDGEYTLTFDFGALGEDYWGSPSDEEYWAQVVCQLWWGADLTMTNVEITGDLKPADTGDNGDNGDNGDAGSSSTPAETGSSSTAEEGSSSSAASSTASSTANSTASSTAANNNNNNNNNNSTAANTDATSDNTNQATGATAGLALAGLALAGAVAVVAKRK